MLLLFIEVVRAHKVTGLHYFSSTLPVNIKHVMLLDCNNPSVE